MALSAVRRPRKFTGSPPTLARQRRSRQLREPDHPVRRLPPTDPLGLSRGMGLIPSANADTIFRNDKSAMPQNRFTRPAPGRNTFAYVAGPSRALTKLLSGSKGHRRIRRKEENRSSTGKHWLLFGVVKAKQRATRLSSIASYSGNRECAHLVINFYSGCVAVVLVCGW